MKSKMQLFNKDTTFEGKDATSDLISRQAAIDALEKVAGFFPYKTPGVRETYDKYNEAWNDAIGRAEMEIESLPSAQPERWWETCFDCPLSHGCPKIKGCTNDQAEQYASEIPDGCPLSAQPEQRWIPCSERLPEVMDWYLGIFKESDTGWINPLPFVCDYVGAETKATTKDYWILRGFTDQDEPVDYYLNLKCVSWRPLPEPYREEGGE